MDKGLERLDAKIRRVKSLQKELDRRTELENMASALFSNGEREKANELLENMDDGIIKGIVSGM